MSCLVRSVWQRYLFFPLQAEARHLAKWIEQQCPTIQLYHLDAVLLKVRSFWVYWVEFSGQVHEVEYACLHAIDIALAWLANCNVGTPLIGNSYCFRNKLIIILLSYRKEMAVTTVGICIFPKGLSGIRKQIFLDILWLLTIDNDFSDRGSYCLGIAHRLSRSLGSYEPQNRSISAKLKGDCE